MGAFDHKNADIYLECWFKLPRFCTKWSLKCIIWSTASTWWKIVLKALTFYEKEISKGMVLLEPGNLLYAAFIKSQHFQVAKDLQGLIIQPPFQCGKSLLKNYLQARLEICCLPRAGLSEGHLGERRFCCRVNQGTVLIAGHLKLMWASQARSPNKPPSPEQVAGGLVIFGNYFDLRPSSYFSIWQHPLLYWPIKVITESVGGPIYLIFITASLLQSQLLNMP